jgi:hypothetical protein
LRESVAARPRLGGSAAWLGKEAKRYQVDEARELLERAGVRP